ncbi:MAG: hypothetical protein OXC05_01960 [Halieaceae bacterium]|nr:hypothetical protein [Halieaceae bacterium]
MLKAHQVLVMALCCGLYAAVAAKPYESTEKREPCQLFSPKCADQATAMNEQYQQRGAIGPVWDNCCIDQRTEPFYSPLIQERAWTSPIWIHAQP